MRRDDDGTQTNLPVALTLKITAARREAEVKKYWQAAERQDFDTALIFAGEGVDLIDAVLPAAEIVRRIVH